MQYLKKIMENSAELPNKIAIKSTLTEVSYSKLWDDICSMKKMVKQYFGKEKRIGIMMPNGSTSLTVFLACSLGEKISIIIDADTNFCELKDYFDLGAIEGLIVGEKIVKRIGDIGKIVGQYESVYFINIGVKGSFEGEYKKLCRGFVAQLTSGTCSRSKIVVRNEESILSEIESLNRLITVRQADTVYAMAPISHSFGLIGSVLLPLYNGATVYISDVFSPREAIKVINSCNIDVIFGVPFMYFMLMQVSCAGKFPSVRSCYSGGGSLTEKVYDQFLNTFGIPIQQFYGTTETGNISLNKLRSESRCVGNPLDHYTVSIKNEYMNAETESLVGEVWIEGEALRDTYYLFDEITQGKAFGKTYNTGDLGYFDKSGQLHIVGRKNGMINVAGRKVNPLEVEEVIRNIVGVEEVVVLGKETSAGQEVEALVVRSNAEITEGDIILACSKKLTPYKIPKTVRFVDSLRKTRTGKYLRTQE